MRNWKDADGNKINDQEFYLWLQKNYKKFDKEYELIVGVDSHLHKGFYRFVTVVCLYKKGRGGYYYYFTTEENKKNFKGTYPARVKARMFHETGLAIELATEIQEKINITPVIHIDASPPEMGELTSLFSEQLKGYVTASGFEGILKPWSFCASSIANKHTK